jgi:beta-phosphoglucomutase-like phosphatase (HAD superfamily)
MAAGAIAAGMRVVGLPDPRMDRGRFADAHFVVSTFAETLLVCYFIYDRNRDL